MSTEPRLHRPDGGYTRDPFLAVGEHAATVRSKIADAIESVVPAGTYLKVAQIVIDNGKVNRQNLVVELRDKPGGKSMP